MRYTWGRGGRGREGEREREREREQLSPKEKFGASHHRRIKEMKTEVTDGGYVEQIRWALLFFADGKFASHS